MSWLGAFLEAQAAELGASENTLAAYRRDLDDFLGWLANEGIAADMADQARIEAYLVHCDLQGLAKSTRARRAVWRRLQT